MAGFNKYAIAAQSHFTNDGTWCVCGERVDACWFHVIYRPYMDLEQQAKYDALFGAA